ncbi:hypothetical protein [Methanobacterium sp.]|uniref:hypothetical protein n=1 Tax=Methanobacterium sp. TaxID=2164 RepID=UPI003C74BCAC
MGGKTSKNPRDFWVQEIIDFINVKIFKFDRIRKFKKSVKINDFDASKSEISKIYDFGF